MHTSDTTIMSVQALWRGFDVNFDMRLLYCKWMLEVDEERNRDLWFGIKFIIFLSISLCLLYFLNYHSLCSLLNLELWFFPMQKCEWFIIHLHCFRTHEIYQAYNQILPILQEQELQEIAKISLPYPFS